MINKLKSAIHKSTIATGIIAGLILTNKDALAQTIASNGKNKAQITSTNINTLKVDPFDRVKGYINTSNPIEVAHYELLLKTEKTQKESHILGLKVALLALYNDTTIPPQDKKALALLVFENGIILPKGTPNSDFYTKKYEQRLENDQNFFDLCAKFGEMQGNLMAELANQKSLQLIERRKQLDEKGKQLDEKGKQLDEKGKQLDEEINKLKKEGEKLDKQIALLQQILQAYESINK